MRMRGKTRTIPILLLLALAIFSQSLITPSAGSVEDAIYIDPEKIESTGYGINDQFNISICTNSTNTDIWGWKFSLTYNPLVLEGVEVSNGDLIINATHPAVFEADEFDDYAGELPWAEAYFEAEPLEPVNVTSGPGILANVTFRVVGWGDSDIKLGDDTRLTGYDAILGFYNIVDDITGQIVDGYFRNVDPAPTHDIAVINVDPNVTKVLAPGSVSINVTIKNNGTADERFAVEVYYDLELSGYYIGSVMVDNLTDGTSRSDIFTWDTTLVEQGNHTIIAKAGPVARENVTANNQNEAYVNVYSPCIEVLPDSIINPDYGVGQQFNVSIYTDYNATEVVGSNDIWGYKLTLSYNPSVLEGHSVANGGGVPQYDRFVGDNATTQYNTTITPVMAGTEEIYVGGTKMKDYEYTIDYATGNITFGTAPDWVLIEIRYLYEMSLMPGATFTAGSFTSGELSLTSGNVSTTTLVSGPGVLATVTFNVTAIGESNITLGPETVLIGYRNPFHNITMPHRRKPGHFTNMGDAAMTKVSLVEMYWGKTKIEAYPTWLNTVNVTVEVQNVWGAPNFTVFAYYGAGVDIEIGNETVIGLVGKKTVTFHWNVSNVPYGDYIISAEVVVPTGDHNPLNDQDSDGTVLIKVPGDADASAIVDYKDLGLLAASYGSATGGPRWDADCDFNCDYNVDYKDLGLLAANYGKTGPY